MNITSDFDAGNLMKCCAGDPKFQMPKEPIFNKVNTKDEDYFCFDMWISPGAWPYMTDTNTGKAGFFFAVSGFSEAKKSWDDHYQCDVFKPRTLRFHFKNMSNQIKLLSYGHMPVYLECDNATYLKLIKGQLPFYR